MLNHLHENDVNACGNCNCAKLADEQPPDDVEVHIVDDVFVKQMRIAKAGTFIPQHSHKYDHLSMLALGRVHVWADGADLGEFEAPRGIVIKAGVKHLFQSLADDTIIYCIHNAARPDVAAILEEHQLVGTS